MRASLLRLRELKQRLRLIRNSRLIESSGFFDREWYLEKNPDVAEASIDPIEHYLVWGGFEGRHPGPNFHSSWYLAKNPDVQRAGMNPLVHYLRSGRKEERAPFPPVFELRRLYDYCKERNSIVFEDAPERIYMQRPKLIGNSSRPLQEGEALCPRPYVGVVENAVIFGGEHLVVVNDNLVLNDELVDFSSPDFGKKAPRVKPHTKGVLFTDYEKPDLHAEEAVLLSCGHDVNYFHWLVECLPKLLLMDSLDEFRDVPLLIPDGLPQSMMTALERVNVNNRPLVFVKVGASCLVERLIVPSALSRIVDRYEGNPVFNVDIVLSHKWLAKLSECLKGNPNRTKKTWRKMYLARRKGIRALENRDEIELMMLDQGFEVVELEGASLDFQIELFSQASVVVTPTGAALTNMLFCQPGTKVIIFMSNHDVTNYYFWTNLGDILNLDVEIVVGQRLFHRTNYYSVHDDYVVDPQLILEALAEKRPLMNYSRYLSYKTLLTSISEECSRLADMIEAQSGRRFLESVEEMIRLEMHKLRSRQAGGYWAIMDGDKVYMRYLNRALAAIEAVLDKPFPGSPEYRMLTERLEQLLEEAETDHYPRIKAVFFVQERFTWPSLESVYDAFASNADCEAQLVYVDFEHANTDTSRDWFAEYNEMNLPMIRSEEYDLSSESPDLAFFVKPYDGIPMQFYIDELDKVVRRSVYIPYFVNWMALKNIDFLIRYHFQLPLHEKAWKIFDAPDFIRESHVQHGSRKGENVELIGHPRFDVIGKLENIRERVPASWKMKIAGRQVVLWNTHSYIADNNWSTFGTLGRQILEYFQNNRQLVLLWRPHPHFFNSLVNGGVMTAEQVEELIARVTDSENIILDQTPDYLSAFSVADALISDASSLLVEFLLTRQPVMYTYNESNESIVHEDLLPALYKASTWDDVERFLRMLVEGKDDKLGERMSVIEKFLPNAAKNVGELIMNQCIQDLTAEETETGRVLARNYSEHRQETV